MESIYRNEIIEKLWRSKEVNQAFAKMQPEDLQEDLKSEVFCVLLELSEEKLQGMYERNELKFYIVRIMLNMIKSDRSGFWKKYRNFTELETKEIKEEHYEEEIFDNLESSLLTLHWYQAELLNIYANEFNSNAKEVSKATGIPYMSIIRTLKQTKNELKKKIRK